MAQAQSEIIYRGTCPHRVQLMSDIGSPPTTVICTLRCLSVCHISQSRHEAGHEVAGGTSCGGQATWAITTNKRTFVRSGDPTGLHLTIGDKYRALVATTCLATPFPGGTSSRSRSMRFKLSLFVARPAVRAVNRGSIKSISWRVWCKYKCPTKYNIDYTIARRASYPARHEARGTRPNAEPWHEGNEYQRDNPQRETGKRENIVYK